MTPALEYSIAIRLVLALFQALSERNIGAILQQGLATSSLCVDNTKFSFVEHSFAATNRGLLSMRSHGRTLDLAAGFGYAIFS